MQKFNIDPDIRKAQTLPGAFYRDAITFELVKEKIFTQCWLYAADSSVVAQPKQVHPVNLLPGVLNEPIVFAKDTAAKVHCLSNVCTHRAKLVVEEAGTCAQLRCDYHGRCFHLDGTFKRMPAFEEAENFPSEADHLPKVPFAEWLNLFFVAINPIAPFEEMVKPIQDRLNWLPFDTLEFVETGTKDYPVNANWALYIDNYLEGLHIPFVHPALNQALDFKQYEYEIFPFCNLQLGIAEEGEPCFDIPEGHQDYGRNVYAYYFWLFPNIMFNVYPWGVSFNSIDPVSHDKTLVRFRSYKFKEVDLDYTVTQLDKTEMEDEYVVESVQKGVQSRFYQAGRFSPSMEPCVHHFHRLIQQCINPDDNDQ